MSIFVRTFAKKTVEISAQFLCSKTCPRFSSSNTMSEVFFPVSETKHLAPGKFVLILNDSFHHSTIVCYSGNSLNMSRSNTRSHAVVQHDILPLCSED